ncbi:cytochrome P450 2C25-like [Babylonia areolata]|uniref:cytochrome P450 2C25-like n=1 Tax=Babylonia areolata TaxID=304850 RepID=UPI003FD62A32
MAFTFSKFADGVVLWANRNINFLILFLIVLIILYLWVRIPSGLPPCPKWVWPGFAHSLIVKGDLSALFRRLRGEHGDVFSFWLAGQLVIVINGFQKIKEAFIDDASNFAWRPDILNCDLFHYGVICTSGRHGREQRQVTKGALDHLQGRGLTPMLLEEVKAFMAAVEREEQAAFDPSVLIQSAMYSSLCSVLVGHRLDYGDQKVCEGVSHFNDNIKLYSDCRLPNFFPFEKFLIGDTFDTKFLRINMADIYRKLINEESELHEEQEAGERADDFLSYYLSAIVQQQEADRKKKEEEEKEGVKKKGKTADSTINKMNMQAAAYDILWHGTVSTAAALRWALLYLLHHPDAQARAQDEIDANFAKGSNPLSADDRKKVPYLEAMVLEVLRLSNVIPFSMAHSVLKEVNFHGYRIPTNAVVVPNLDSVLMDPQLFPNPQAFLPERFISTSTGQVACPAHFIPFFFGNRGCLGDKIAKDTIFHFLFGILQNYKLQPEEGSKLPPLTRGFKLVSLPQDYKVRFSPRW